MPEQKPGRSNQVVATPDDFLKALKIHLQIEDFDCDLAADESNKICEKFYDESMDSLSDTCSWNSWGWVFCNPPYAKIGPWVEKACSEVKKGAKIAMLLPAGVGSNWWRDYVHRKCSVLLLNGRLTFKGHTSPYPKDLVILLYHTRGIIASYEVWDWRKTNDQALARGHKLIVTV